MKKNNKINKSIIKGNINKFLIFIGPCSIHNNESFIKFCTIIKKINIKYKKYICFCIRMHLEKPRSIIGWKGFIYEPKIDNTINIKEGIKKSINLIKRIKNKNISLSTEVINFSVMKKIEKYISFIIIGARNTESQLYREYSSYKKIPIGFKNNTEGNIDIAINSVIASSKKTFFVKNNKYTITNGNNNCFIILRGGKKPNYYKKCIKKTNKKIKDLNINTKIIIDCNHGNSEKKEKKQLNVIKYIRKKILKLNIIKGIMIESNIKSGNQTIKRKIDKYISITDECSNIKDVYKEIKKIYNVIKVEVNNVINFSYIK